MSREQSRQLARVRTRIQRAVVDFVAAVPVGRCFSGEELDRHAQDSACCTPGSATRVLRHLRQRGALNYVVADRGKATYRRIPLEVFHQMELFP